VKRCHICGRFVLIFGKEIDGGIVHTGTCMMTAMALKVQRITIAKQKAIIQEREKQLEDITGEEVAPIEIILREAEEE